MFWKKKNTVEFDGLPVVLSRRRVCPSVFDYLRDDIGKQFLAYKQGNEWRGLVGYEQFREEIDTINQKLDLVLDHLNLEYVAESEKKEPAKLVEKKEYQDLDWNQFDCITKIQAFAEKHYEPEPKKKKRGRPKKK